MKNAELNKRLRAANPAPVDSGLTGAGASLLGRIGQVFLTLLAVLVAGVGVAWAASGTNPIKSVFLDDIKVVESNVGMDSFSLLEPMTQELLYELPPGIAQMIHFQSSSMAAARNLRSGLRAFGKDKTKFEPDPALISAIGQSQTNLGTPVVLLVVADQFCAYFGTNGRRSGSCGEVERIDRQGTVGWGSEFRDSSLNRVYGLFNDRVAAIDVAGDGKPPIEIPGNALELRNMESRDTRLIALDEEGNELFKTGVPLSMMP